MKCLICGSEKQKYLFTINKKNLSPEAVYKIWKCEECQFWHANGPIDHHILHQIYGRNFHDSSQQDAIDAQSGNAPIVLNAIKRTDQIRKIRQTGSLLDIGAGKGYFVKVATEYFDAIGIELSPDAVKAGVKDGLNLICGDFLSQDFEIKKFDIVTLWDVLSSFEDPNPVISKIGAILKPGGLLVMTLPYASSLTARILGRFWPLMIPPINFSYFSRSSVHRLMRKYNFSLLRMSCDAKKVTLDFIIRKFIRMMGISINEKFIPKRAMKINVNLNTGDIVSVYAIKKA